MITPYYDRNGITLYLGDCREVLPQITEKVDLVLTDPPYGCGKAEWDSTFPEEWYALCKRFEKMIVIITGATGLKDSVNLVGDDFVDVVAARNLNGMTRSAIGFGNWLAATVANGKPRQGVNCFDFVVCREMPNHPSPKPIEYMTHLVARISEDSDLILDPFLGSGTTAVAAKKLGRRCIGIEINEDYLKIAIERLRQEVLL